MISLVFFLFRFSVLFAQYPIFPPSNVTNTIDRDQMVWQLGLSFPNLSSKLNDPNAPLNAHPSDSLKPENNWTDDAKHTITRSGHGLWNNYCTNKAKDIYMEELCPG